MNILPKAFEQHEEELIKAGLKRGVDYEFSEKISTEAFVKQSTVAEQFLKGNRKDRRRLVALSRKRK